MSVILKKTSLFFVYILFYFALQTRVLKAAAATFLLVCFSSFNKSTCETGKNIFHFTSKALFLLEKIKF